MILALVAINIVIVAAIVIVKLNTSAENRARQRAIGKGHIASVPPPKAPRPALTINPHPPVIRQGQAIGYDMRLDKIYGADALHNEWGLRMEDHKNMANLRSLPTVGAENYGPYIDRVYDPQSDTYHCRDQKGVWHSVSAMEMAKSRR